MPVNRPLELGEKVLVLKDGDIPNDVLPIVGYVVAVPESEYDPQECWISSDPDNTPDNCCHEYRNSFFSLVYFAGVLHQTEDGRKEVIRYSEKDILGMEHLRGIARFLRKVEKDRHETV
jgi:hypothetical protein